MSGLFASSGDLPDLMAGRVSVIASAALPGLEQLAVDGVDVWAAMPAAKGTRLTRPGVKEDSPAVPLNLPPAGTILLVSREEGEFAALHRWWRASAGRVVPVVVAADAGAALRPVLEQLSRELQTVNARCVQLERNLTETRIDYEETRTAIAAVSRTLGHRTPSQPTLETATEPSDEQVTTPAGQARFLVRQRLGRKLDGLAVIAFYLDEVPESTSEIMRVRLQGEESGRILAAWKVPLAGVQPGWLALDLPAPLGIERETALLEVAADIDTPGALALSLERAWVPAEVACAVEGAELAGRALALRIWTAAVGERFVMPAYWDWDEVGSSLPLLGVPQGLSRPEWDLARVLTGEFSSAAIGNDAARVIARVGSRENAALLLPVVTLGGTDVLRLRCAVRSGDPAQVQFAAWVAGRDAAVESLDDLAALGSGGRFSGWRGFHNGNEAELTLAIPVAIGQQAQVVLGVRGQGAGSGARLEFTDLSFLATRDPADLRAQQKTAQVLWDQAEPVRQPVMPSAPLPVESIPVFETVELNQHLVGQRGYQHLDMTVRSLAGRGHRWPGLRFKLALTRHEPVLEFRRAAGWPATFAQWPGTETDQFGPVLRVKVTEAERLLGSLSHPKDLAMVASLLQVLSGVAGHGVRLAGLDDTAGKAWLNAAASFADALGADFRKTAA
jgi:hypothetical protein